MSSLPFEECLKEVTFCSSEAHEREGLPYSAAGPAVTLLGLVPTSSLFPPSSPGDTRIYGDISVCCCLQNRSNIAPKRAASVQGGGKTPINVGSTAARRNLGYGALVTVNLLGGE